MATRGEMLVRLAELGYAGPTSYGKEKLQAILDAQLAQAGQAAAPPDEAGQAGAEPASAAAEVRYTEWMGLKRGDVLRVAGEKGTRYVFRFYFNDGKQEYVEVYGGSPSKRKVRSLRPEKLLRENGKPVLDGA